MANEYQDFLAHYGVKGQKWGVRNYQNPDGTLIHPKGRKKAEKKTAESDTWKKKESKWLSDDELNRRNNRLQREFQYRQNIDNRHPAKKWAVAALSTIFLASAVAVTKNAVTKNYHTALTKGAEFLKNKNVRSSMNMSLHRLIKSKSKWVL